MSHIHPFFNSRAAARQPGFTLIELLVVMAIIGILAAALLPTLGYVREAGHATRCETNLKNLAAGVINFANDNGGYMPLSRPAEVFEVWSNRYEERTGWVNWVRANGQSRDEWRDGGGGHRRQQRDPWTSDQPQRQLFEQPAGRPLVRWWGEAARRSIQEGSLWPYVRRDLSNYLCPRFRRRDTYDTLTVPEMASDPYRSYVMNNWFGSERRIQWIESNHGISPSRLMLFSDMQPKRNIDGVQVCQEWCAGGVARAQNGELTPGDAGQNVPTQSIGVIHRGRAHVIFVDGHVEAFVFSAVNPHSVAATWGELVYKLSRGTL